jgi:hypothetical protein
MIRCLLNLRTDMSPTPRIRRRPQALAGPDLEHTDQAWTVVACLSSPIWLAPGDGDAEVRVDDSYTLVLSGHPLTAQDPAGARGLRSPGHGRLTPRASRRRRPPPLPRLPRPTGYGPCCSVL